MFEFSYMYIVLELIILIMHVLLLNQILFNNDLIDQIILSLATILVEFCVFSGLFFSIDIFSFKNVVLIQLIAIIIALLLVFALKAGKLSLHWKINYKGFAISLIIVILCLPFVISKFELFGMGQDQGVYQTEAIAIINGESSILHDFNEYNVLDDEQKLEYQEKTDEIYTGFYEVDDAVLKYPTASEKTVKNPVEGWFHGTHTFSAMLAFWGELFGMENMAQIQTLIWVCTVFLMSSIVRKLNGNYLENIFVTGLFAFSPLLIWIAKGTFTEMFLTLIIALYIYGILDEKDEWLASVAIIGFAFAHVSFFVLVPIFVLIQTYLYVRTSRRVFLILNIINGVALSSGYLVMALIGPQYFFDNLDRMYISGIISADNILLVLILVAIGIVIFSLILFFLKTPEWMKKISTTQNVQLYCRMAGIVCLFFILIYWYKIGILGTPESTNFKEELQTYWGDAWLSFLHLAITAFIVCSGIFVVPVAVYGCYKKWENDIKEKEIGIYVLFIYCILFLSAFFRREVYYYYYYARYLVIYLPILFLVFFLTIRGVKKIAIIVVSGLSFLAMMPFSTFMLNHKDHTWFEWENLIDLTDFITDDAAVIIEDDDLNRRMGLALKYNSGADIFPIFADINKEVDTLQSQYSSVYYLTQTPDEMNSTMDKIQYPWKIPVYKDSLYFQEYKVDVLPRKATIIKQDVILYELTDSYIYHIDLDGDNVGVLNGYKLNGDIISYNTGGTVMFGPYIALEPGKYEINMVIDVEKREASEIGYIRVYSQAGNRVILEPIPLSSFENTNGQILVNLGFILESREENIEVLVETQPGVEVKIHDYEIAFQYEFK